MKYYLMDENHNLVEGYNKEQFLAFLEDAIEQGSLEGIEEDSAFVTKIKSQLNGTTHHIEFVTQAQYNQLEQDEELVANTYYFITDDNTAEDIEEDIEELQNQLPQINETLTQLTDVSLGSANDFTDALTKAKDFYLLRRTNLNDIRRTCLASYGVTSCQIKLITFVSTTGVIVKWTTTFSGSFASGMASYVNNSWNIYYDNQSAFSRSSYQTLQLSDMPSLFTNATYHIQYKSTNYNNLFDFGIIYISSTIDVYKFINVPSFLQSRLGISEISLKVDTSGLITIVVDGTEDILGEIYVKPII